MSRLPFAAAILFLASCFAPPPPLFAPPDYPSMENVADGATIQELRKALGPPNDRSSGWWIDGIRFEEDFEVWYYAGKGRVVLDRFNGRVVLTQADPDQPKHAVRQPFFAD